jgi:hypothetical protein
LAFYYVNQPVVGCERRVANPPMMIRVIAELKTAF